MSLAKPTLQLLIDRGHLEGQKLLRLFTAINQGPVDPGGALSPVDFMTACLLEYPQFREIPELSLVAMLSRLRSDIKSYSGHMEKFCEDRGTIDNAYVHPNRQLNFAIHFLDQDFVTWESLGKYYEIPTAKLFDKLQPPVYIVTMHAGGVYARGRLVRFYPEGHKDVSKPTDPAASQSSAAADPA